VSLSQEGQ